MLGATEANPKCSRGVAASIGSYNTTEDDLDLNLGKIDRDGAFICATFVTGHN